MASPIKSPSEPDRPPAAILHQPASPRFPSGTPIAGANRKIAIAVDLSDESAYAVKWAVQNYLRPGDSVILLHVRPTSVLYGADWGVIDHSVTDEESQQKLEDDFDSFTTTKANDLAHPLVEGNIPFKIHIVKDHDMKERLCLEVERLGLSAVIMGSRGFGASRRISTKSRLGSVSDYCVHHCVCPVVVVRYPDDKDVVFDDSVVPGGSAKSVDKDQGVLHPVPEEEPIYHDASDKATSNQGEIAMDNADIVEIFAVSSANSYLKETGGAAPMASHCSLSPTVPCLTAANTESVKFATSSCPYATCPSWETWAIRTVCPRSSRNTVVGNACVPCFG